MSLIQKAKENHQLSPSEIVELLSSDQHNEELFNAAHEIRIKYSGEEVHLKGLLEFSNLCKQHCFYCGLRAENRQLKRYKLSPLEVLDFAQKAISYGYHTIVMQSGENESYRLEELCEMIFSIRQMGASVTLSLGEKRYEEYEAYKRAGADRYLLRIETTDSRLYAKLHPKMSHSNRFQCLRWLQEIGFETGSGSLIGLPQQSLDSIANDLLFFQESDFDMVGIGPFIPNPETPLANSKGGDFILARKVMALLRLLMPYINIPATTAMETLHPLGRTLALESGANVVMPVITEGEYRALYKLYPGKICINDTPAHCRHCITSKITALGQPISPSRGDSRRFIMRQQA